MDAKAMELALERLMLLYSDPDKLPLLTQVVADESGRRALTVMFNYRNSEAFQPRPPSEVIILIETLWRTALTIHPTLDARKLASVRSYANAFFENHDELAEYFSEYDWEIFLRSLHAEVRRSMTLLTMLSGVAILLCGWAEVDEAHMASGVYMEVFESFILRE